MYRGRHMDRSPAGRGSLILGGHNGSLHRSAAKASLLLFQASPFAVGTSVIVVAVMTLAGIASFAPFLIPERPSCDSPPLQVVLQEV